MNENRTWSISIGEWAGVPFRVHSLFLLAVAVTLFCAQIATLGAVEPVRSSVGWLAVTGLVVLYLSVLLHETAHWFVARRLGGGADEIILAPFGGLAPLRPIENPRADWLAHAAGPIANFLVAWGVCFPLLALRGQASSVVGLIDPFAPAGITSSVVIGWEALPPLAFWINWCLFLVNLIPADPFDGGPLLRAALRMYWPHANRWRVHWIISKCTKAAAVGLAVAAWLASTQPMQLPFPTWFALALIAGLIYFGTRQYEQRMLDEVTQPPWEATEEWHDPATNPLENTLELASSPQERLAREAEPRSSRGADWDDDSVDDGGAEDRRLDEVLAKLHEVGLTQLSPRGTPCPRTGQRSLSKQTLMARHELPREDLLREATALVERIELQLPGEAEHVVIGFRREGSGSLYAGAEFVLQFNAAGELRRAFRDGRMFKAEKGQLVALDRNRSDQEVALVREDLSEVSQAEWLARVERQLDGWLRQLDAGEFQVVGQVPVDADVVGRARRWLEGLPRPVQVAARPNVK